MLQRALWSRYYQQHTDAFIYVIDSGDRERIDESRENLRQMCNNELTKTCPLLVLANKQDLPDAMDATEITEKLQLARLEDREWCKSSRKPAHHVFVKH